MNDSLAIPHFAVLLAAYNGMNWLAPQIESILSQRCVQVTIFVSIDLSSDATESWLKKIAAVNSNVVILPVGGRFGGAAKNFFRLIRDVDFSGFDYISFADQDDVWLDDKLCTAHEKIMKDGLSAYSGNVTAFWPDGRKSLIDKAQKQTEYDFLFEAAGPGCTYVLKVTDALRFKDFLLGNWTLVNEVALHDWLIYAWFRSNKLPWYIDPAPKMLYRQHGNNQVGANTGLGAMKARFKLLRSGWYRGEISKIASLLTSKRTDLPVCLVEEGLVPRRFLFANLNNTRRRLRDQIVFVLIVTLGIY